MTLIASRLRESDIKVFTILKEGHNPQSIQADSYEYTGGTYDFYKGDRMVFSIHECMVDEVTEGAL